MSPLGLSGVGKNRQDLFFSFLQSQAAPKVRSGADPSGSWKVSRGMDILQKDSPRQARTIMEGSMPGTERC